MAECIRTAWLTLGALTLPLEDESRGYYCTQLDLGYPEVRDVTTNRPDQNGIDDRTQYFGSRLVSANILAQEPPVDDVAAVFAPFMVPSEAANSPLCTRPPGRRRAHNGGASE